MEEQRLGRPTLQQARDNFFKSSDASETDPSFNWVDDVNLPLPQKVQVYLEPGFEYGNQSKTTIFCLIKYHSAV